MAKLSRPRPSFASTIRTDPESWNPPIQTSKAQTSARQSMRPPLPRLSITQNVPHTPSLQRGQDTLAQGSIQSSGKKKHRKRSGRKKKQHRDSFREHNTSVSIGTTSTAQKQPTQVANESRSDGNLDGDLTPLQTKFKTVQDERRERTSKQHNDITSLTRDTIRDAFKKENTTDTSPQRSLLDRPLLSPVRLLANARKSQDQEPVQMQAEPADDLSNIDQLKSDKRVKSPKSIPSSSIPVEQQPVFDREPEMFGVYAASDAESEPEDKTQEVKTEETEEDEETNVRPESAASAIEETEASNENVMAMEDPTTNHKPQIVSDVIKPRAPKLGNGRVACPFADTYDCDKTFASQSSAIRHAYQHTNADKYKCTLCDKAWSREDSYSQHMMKNHGKKIVNPKKPANNSIRTEQPHMPIIQTSSDDSITTKNSTHDRPTQADERARDESMDRIDAGLGIDREFAPVTSAEEETESDEASDNEDTRREPRSHVSTTNTPAIPIHSKSHEAGVDPKTSTIGSPSVISAQPASVTVLSSNKLKRKVPLSFSQSRKKDSPRPRKRYRGESSDQDRKRETVGGQHSDVAASDNSDATSESQDKDKDEEPQPPESDTEMRDVDRDSDPDAVDDETTSPVKPKKAQTTPKVLVIVPKLPKKTYEDMPTPHSNIGTGPSNTSRSVKQIGKSLSRNGTLNGFLERSAARSSSVEAAPPRIQKQPRGRLATTGRGESSKSHAERNKMNETQSRIDSVAGKIVRKIRPCKENSDPGEGAESGTDLENHPRATTVARRGLIRKGKSKPSLRNSLQRPSASQNNSENSENDGDQDRGDDDSNASEEYESSQQKQKLKSKDESRRISKAPQGNRTGRFSDEEIAILHAWRDSFCDLHDMSIHEFNEMMTASTKKSAGGKEWRPYQNFIKKRDFLDEYYEQLPDRNRRAMIRFRERNFTNAEKGAWTTADDKELKRLVRECGSKWVEIAEIMGRTSDAVHQRWRHKLNSGEEIAEGKWTDNETEELGRIVADMAHEQGKDADESDLDIKWKVVSQKLGNGRSAQQCSNRWRITTHKRTEDGFIRVPHVDRIPLLKAGPRTPSKMSQRLTPKERPKRRVMPKRQPNEMKSAEYVKDSDDEVENMTARSDEEVEESGGEEVKEVSTVAFDAEELTSSDVNSDDSGYHQSSSIKEDTDAGSAREDNNTNAAHEASISDDGDVDDIDNHKHLPETTSTPTSRYRADKLSTPSEKSHRKVVQMSKTPANSKRPLKSSTPANVLSLTQLHATTQATSETRPTTGKRSRVPDTEIRPDRPSPVVSINRKPLSSPLDMLAQAAVEQRLEEQEDEESDEDSGEGSDSPNESEEHYKSPATFTSAKSDPEDKSGDEEERSQAHSKNQNKSRSGSPDWWASDGSDDEAADASDSDFEGVKEESDEEESAEPDQEHGQPSQATNNGFWGNIYSMLPFSQNSSSSQQPAGLSKQGHQSLMDALRGMPSKEESSDSE